jgi:drug/metabolite transporter (DMT)-like permease
LAIEIEPIKKRQTINLCMALIGIFFVATIVHLQFMSSIFQKAQCLANMPAELQHEN